MENIEEWAKKKRKALCTDGVAFVTSLITVITICIDGCPLWIRILCLIITTALLSVGGFLTTCIIREKVNGYLEKFGEVHELLTEEKRKEPCYNSCNKKFSEIDTFMNKMNGIHKNVTKDLKGIKKDVKRKNYLQYKTSNTITMLLEFLRNHPESEKLRIICYGRKGYETVVETIQREKLRVMVEMIVCDPEQNPEVCNEKDKGDILNAVGTLLEYGKDIEVFGAKVPPAIRASVIYDKEDNPIWGTVQTYQFKRVDGKLTVEKPENSLVIVCAKEDDEIVFQGVIKYFRKEYKRLWKSRKQAVLGENGAIFRDIPKEQETG